MDSTDESLVALPFGSPRLLREALMCSGLTFVGGRGGLPSRFLSWPQTPSPSRSFQSQHFDGFVVEVWSQLLSQKHV